MGTEVVTGRAAKPKGEVNEDLWGVGLTDNTLSMGKPCTWGSG